MFYNNIYSEHVRRVRYMLTEVRNKGGFSRFMKMYVWMKTKFGDFPLNRKVFL